MTAPAPSAPSASSAPPLPPPSRQDPTVARASGLFGLLGGPWGRRAAGRSWWTPLRVVLALAAVVLALAFVEKSPCADGNWTAYKQYTHACYSDVVPLWSAEGLSEGKLPYRDHPVEYPVLTGALMEAGAVITRAISAAEPRWTQVLIFDGVTCALLAICGLVMVAATVGAAGRRPFDAAIAALSPLLVFHAYSNWDLLAMALASAGIWAWARKRPTLAGVLIGLGTAAKLYPVLLLLPLVLLAWRTRIWRPAARAIAGAIVAWVVVNLPVAVLYFDGWAQFYRFSISRPAEASTVWFMGNYLGTVGPGGGYPPSWTPPGAAVAVLFLAAMAGVGYVALRAPVRPRLGQLAFLVVLGFLLTTKVWSPQYSIWLVPLVALARPRWRLNLVWQFAEVGVWILTLLWLMGFGVPDRGLDYQWLMFMLLVRDGLLIALAVLTIREIWRPEFDVVRMAGLDDPAGGVFDGVAAPPVGFRPVPADEQEPAGDSDADEGVP